MAEKQFKKTLLKDEFKINGVMSLHYFEFAKDYVFEGERHSFWEFLYVDKGEVEVMADATGFKLTQGDIIFHKPDEFHSVWANKRIAPNLIVMSFDCNSAAMKYFENKLLILEDSERNILANIVKEGANSFQYPFDMPLVKRSNQAFGAEQLIKLYLKTFLINLVRKGSMVIHENRLSSIAKERSEEDIVKRIIQYMTQNLSSNITLGQIGAFSGMGSTMLKQVFKEKTGKSTMEYFKLLKIEHAKQLIRQENSNLTKVSDRLGYSSIHSFSRHFKRVTGMSPSEYSRTIKARFE